MVAPRSLDRERSSALPRCFVYWRNASTFLIILAVVKLSILFACTDESSITAPADWRAAPCAFCIAIYQVRVSMTRLQHAWQSLFTITWYDSLHTLTLSMRIQFALLRMRIGCATKNTSRVSTALPVQSERRLYLVLCKSCDQVCYVRVWRRVRRMEHLCQFIKNFATGSLY